MDNPVKAAEQVENAADARKLHSRIEGELNDNYQDWDLKQIDEHDRALNMLKAEHKTVATDQKRRQASAATSAAQSQKRGKQQARKRTSAKAARKGRSAGQRAWRDTGIPGTAQSATQLTLQALGGFVGLAFVYLLLSRPKVLAGVATGLSTALRVLVDPVDPLRKAHPVQAAEARAALGQANAPKTDVTGNPDVAAAVGDLSSIFANTRANLPPHSKAAKPLYDIGRALAPFGP